MDNFRAKASICLESPQELIIIQRGTTASFYFDFNDKPYDISDLEQITFIFEQDGNIADYSMFSYLNNKYDANNFTVDPHFHYDTDLQSIIFILSSEETKMFRHTARMESVKFEIAIKLNTDHLGVQELDDINILTQPKIKVLDSLYAHIS